MRELSLRACRVFCLAVGAVALALCMGLFCQPEEAHAAIYSVDADGGGTIEYEITDVYGTDLLSGESFDANTLNQGLYYWASCNGLAVGGYITVTDISTGQKVAEGGQIGLDEGLTLNVFLDPGRNYRTLFVGGHSYNVYLRWFYYGGDGSVASNNEVNVANVTISFGTAAEEVPDGSGDGDGSGELDGDGADAPVDVGPDDSGDDGSGGGEGADDDASETDDSGPDDATGEGGADEDDGIAPIAPGSESDSSSQDSGTGAAASSRTSDSEGSEVEATEEGGTARADASGGSDSEGGQAEDDKAGSPQAETTVADLAQLGEVYKVGQSTESDGETTEQSSSIQLAQFEVYGIPLIVLMVAIVLFGSLPFGVATRLGALGFGVRRRTRLG